MADENPTWGYTKIRDAIRGLKIEIGRTTVSNILEEAGMVPAPERGRTRTWKKFINYGVSDFAKLADRKGAKRLLATSRAFSRPLATSKITSFLPRGLRDSLMLGGVESRDARLDLVVPTP